jgi:hypothetical protein
VTDHREQLEAQHTRHVEIAENDIGDLLPNLNQCGESSVLFTTYFPKSLEEATWSKAFDSFVRRFGRNSDLV